MRECVTHHICDCHRERMDALEAALTRVLFPIMVALTWCPHCRGTGQSQGLNRRCIVCADLRDARKQLLATRAAANAPLGE